MKKAGENFGSEMIFERGFHKKSEKERRTIYRIEDVVVGAMESVEKRGKHGRAEKKAIQRFLNNYGKTCGIFGKSQKTATKPETAIFQNDKNPAKCGFFPQFFCGDA